MKKSYKTKAFGCDRQVLGILFCIQRNKAAEKLIVMAS